MRGQVCRSSPTAIPCCFLLEFDHKALQAFVLCWVLLLWERALCPLHDWCQKSQVSHFFLGASPSCPSRHRYCLLLLLCSWAFRLLKFQELRENTLMPWLTWRDPCPLDFLYLSCSLLSNETNKAEVVGCFCCQDALHLHRPVTNGEE